MTDFADLTDERINIVAELSAGNAGPLATWLEKGGELTADQRSLLVKFLRGEVKRTRGNRRTYSDNANAQNIRLALQGLQRDFAIKFGSYGSYTRALEAYHAMHPEMEYEKIRGFAKRGLWPKSYLEAIDRAREAALKD